MTPVRGAAMALVLVGAGLGLSRAAEPTDPLIAILSAIDVAPTPELLAAAGGPDAATRVRELAAATDDLGLANDVGVRVRALRALAGDPSPEAHARLLEALDAGAGTTLGSSVVVMGAAAEALGDLGDPADVPRLAALLEFEPSRDLRAIAARALGAIGSPAAIDPLRERLLREPREQVRLAITEALRALEP
ncbi:MAG: HEAT repeat domain-containing protein [Kofleriaceae bacterium]